MNLSYNHHGLTNNAGIFLSECAMSRGLRLACCALHDTVRKSQRLHEGDQLDADASSGQEHSLVSELCSRLERDYLAHNVVRLTTIVAQDSLEPGTIIRLQSSLRQARSMESSSITSAQIDILNDTLRSEKLPEAAAKVQGNRA